MPITIDGTPFRTSAAKRTAVARPEVRYSDRWIPATIPTGTARSAARPIRISVPTMAFAMPPPVSPTGFGMCVKKSQVRAGSPCLTTKKRMNPRGRSASRTERPLKPTTIPDTMRRRAALRVTGSPCRDGGGAGDPRRTLGADAPDQEAREGVDDDRDQEQHETDLDQGVEVEVVRRLGELVGDDGGHRVLRREEGERDLGVVPDHHGDRHRLAEGAAETEHHGADDPAAPVEEGEPDRLP